jgi:hypothetical protein
MNLMVLKLLGIAVAAGAGLLAILRDALKERRLGWQGWAGLALVVVGSGGAICAEMMGQAEESARARWLAAEKQPIYMVALIYYARTGTPVGQFLSQLSQVRIELTLGGLIEDGKPAVRSLGFGRVSAGSALERSVALRCVSRGRLVGAGTCVGLSHGGVTQGGGWRYWSSANEDWRAPGATAAAISGLMQWHDLGLDGSVMTLGDLGTVMSFEVLLPPSFDTAQVNWFYLSLFPSGGQPVTLDLKRLADDHGSLYVNGDHAGWVSASLTGSELLQRLRAEQGAS